MPLQSVPIYISLVYYVLGVFTNISTTVGVWNIPFYFQVAINSDAAYLLFIILFSVSNGYIGSIAMMYGPKMLQSGEDQGRAASLLVSFLVLGLAVGAFTSQLLVALLWNIWKYTCIYCTIFFCLFLKILARLNLDLKSFLSTLILKSLG